MELPDDLAADLAALADGRLHPGRRAAVKERVAAEPSLAAALERQRAAIRTVAAAAAEVEAPHALRVRIDALGRAPSRRPARRWLPFAGLAGAAAAVLLALVVAGGGGLDVRATLAAALRPGVATASVLPGGGPLLAEQVDGVDFPHYGEKFGWEPQGVRSDRIEGRDMRTVFYEREGRRIAYTIVAGEALEPPSDAASLTVEGTPLRALRAGGREVVTWERQGRTCVLSGAGVARGELAELAAWKGQGAVEF